MVHKSGLEKYLEEVSGHRQIKRVHVLFYSGVIEIGNGTTYRCSVGLQVEDDVSHGSVADYYDEKYFLHKDDALYTLTIDLKARRKAVQTARRLQRMGYETDINSRPISAIEDEIEIYMTAIRKLRKTSLPITHFQKQRRPKIYKIKENKS